MYPIIIAAISVLYLLSSNIAEVGPQIIPEIGLLLLSACGVAAAVLGIVFIVTKNVNKSLWISAVITTPLLYYGHIINILGATKILWPDKEEILVGILICAGLIAVGAITTILMRKKAWLEIVNRGLNVTSYLLLGMCLITMISQVISLKEEEPYNDYVTTEETRRDIYYIITDGYGNYDELLKNYQFDNSNFEEQLRQRGFFVVPKGTSNYGTTHQSLASSLNMKYLDPIKGSGRSYNDIIRATQNSEVAQTLKKVGYKYISFDSGWSPTSYNKYADIEISNSRIRGFSQAYTDSTIAAVILQDDSTEITRKRIAGEISGLEELVKNKQAKFVLCHIVCPHPPFIFKEDGSTPTKEERKPSNWTNMQGYTQQIKYLNKEILAAVDIMLQRSDTKPIIIIQGDHGPASLSEGQNYYIYSDSEKEEQRLSILNAIYLPDSDEAKNIKTPVNTFRVIFNTYFDGSYELLEDRNYWCKDIFPLKPQDVTEVIRRGK